MEKLGHNEYDDANDVNENHDGGDDYYNDFLEASYHPIPLRHEPSLTM